MFIVDHWVQTPDHLWFLRKVPSAGQYIHVKWPIFTVSSVWKYIQLYITVFCYLTPCSLIEIYRPCGVTCCNSLLHRKWTQRFSPKPLPQNFNQHTLRETERRQTPQSPPREPHMPNTSSFCNTGLYLRTDETANNLQKVDWGGIWTNNPKHLLKKGA